MKNTFTRLMWLTLLVVGVMVGRMTAQQIMAGKSASAPIGNYTTFMPMDYADTVFSRVPAPDVAISSQPLYPNEYDKATYWAIEDIRKSHQTLVDAEKAGRIVDPNTTLHDFPYWTRTYGMWLRHVPEKPTGPTAMAEQHMGYKQHIVVTGGAGTVQVGGQLQSGTLHVENGRTIWGEMRGPAITGGETFSVQENDRVLIPANTPALWKATSPGGLTYMVIKDTAKQYPWDLIR